MDRIEQITVPLSKIEVKGFKITPPSQSTREPGRRSRPGPPGSLRTVTSQEVSTFTSFCSPVPTIDRELEKEGVRGVE